MWFAVAAGLFAAIPGKTEDRRVSPVAPRPREGPLTEAIAGVSLGRGNASACPTPAVRDARRDRLNWVESGCGAVAVGWACLFPPHSSGGALVAQP